MSVDLYYIVSCPPCRSVRLAAKLIGVELNHKLLDLTKGDTRTPEYLKMNPAHSVPTIDDNGFYLHESRAIITYLANKYGKDDSLYPKDPQKRAIVDEMLNFDVGTLFASFGSYVYPAMFGGHPLDPEKKKKLEEALGFFNTFLERREFAAGNSVTIADASLATTVSTIDIVGIDISPYKNVTKWFAKCKEILPDYEVSNHQGALGFKEKYDLTVGGKK